MNTASTSYIRKLLAAQIAHLASRMDNDGEDHVRLAIELAAATEALRELLTPAPAVEPVQTNPAAQLIYDTVGTNRNTLGHLAHICMSSDVADIQRGGKVVDNLLRIERGSEAASVLEEILRKPPMVNGEDENRRKAQAKAHRAAEREAAAS